MLKKSKLRYKKNINKRNIVFVKHQNVATAGFYRCRLPICLLLRLLLHAQLFSTN